MSKNQPSKIKVLGNNYKSLTESSHYDRRDSQQDRSLCHQHNLIPRILRSLHIDDTLMSELDEIKNKIHPHEIFLVLDAMTGHDAVTMAQTFHDRLSLTGVILTKLDGDARGGAALSVKAETGVAIKFIGVINISAI